MGEREVGGAAVVCFRVFHPLSHSTGQALDMVLGCGACASIGCGAWSMEGGLAKASRGSFRWHELKKRLGYFCLF